MNALTRKRWQVFRSHRRGFSSLVLLTLFFSASLFSELLANNVPLLLRHHGKLYFPVAQFYPATEFGGDSPTAPDYRALIASAEFKERGGWALWPLIPFHPNESHTDLPSAPPTTPSSVHWLGTDDRGRDLLARLLYGFRNSMVFALVSCLFTVVFSYLIGATQGYLGGRVDFYGQRVIEIWSALPVLYLILFLISVFPASLVLLTAIWIAFSWIGLSGYIRAEVLRLRHQDFVTSARALGASSARILFKHILPNALTPIVTFSPFLIAAAISSLAALDYLGMGLPPPAASWGELLKQGKENLSSWWLSLFPFLSLFATLLCLNFIGEAARASFDKRL